MKRLILSSLLCVGCTHSSNTTAPASSTAVIPTATASTPASADPPPTAAPHAASADPCDDPTAWPVEKALRIQGGQIVILAWKQKVDERPLYVDEALVWEKPQAGFVVAQVYRHPKEENEFRLSVVYDAPIVPEKSFDHAPTATDMKEFLKHTTWSNDSTGFKQTAGRVCTDNWSRVIGAPPPADVVK